MKKVGEKFGACNRVPGMRILRGKMPLLIIGLVMAMVFFAACSQPTGGTNKVDNPPTMSRYVVQPSPYIGNDKIRYSYSYGGYDFYYIHLGELSNIPIFYLDPHYFGTFGEESYVFTTEKTSTNTIEDTVSRSSQTALNVVDQYTNSTSIGDKLSTELDTKYSLNAGVKAGIGGISASVDTGFELGTKLAAESDWNWFISNSQTTGFQNTTSLTDTYTSVTTYTETNRETYTYNYSKANDDVAGWYRYTYFAASDVYLYVIKDAAGVVYYEFREFIKPDERGWKLDYCEDMSFSKSDSTN
ncbi:MAG: hypothetical protein FWF29_13150, partial [Treponema sp.]|nr:hypothetical protein [Treponema sp.]